MSTFGKTLVPRFMLLLTLISLLAACGSTPASTSSPAASTAVSTAPAASAASAASAAPSSSDDASAAPSSSGEASAATSVGAEGSPAASASAEAATTATNTTAGATTAAACADATAPGDLGNATIRYLAGQAEDEPNYTNAISTLSREFAEQNPSVTYEFEQAQQTGLDQQILLLAGSNSLPMLFADPAVGTVQEMFDNGLILDVEQTFRELGLLETMRPVAVDLVKTINGGRMAALPTELNIEGIWYNKQIFEANGLQVPTTWAELVQAAETLNGAGIQPLAASGEQGWPLTRLVGQYAARKLGPDVMQRVGAGEVKLTDPGFVEAAQAVADLGTKGYFGEGVATIDYATAVDQFLQGQAAMLYMGSWVLGDFANAERNQIGSENIGLFNFPAVEGGQGSADDWIMNAGLTVSLSKNRYEENPAAAGAWLKHVFCRFGEQAINEHGLITGFQAEAPADLPALNQTVLSTIDTIETPVLWFEAPFNSETTTLSQRNAALLVTGESTPEQFLTELQETLGQ